MSNVLYLFGFSYEGCKLKIISAVISASIAFSLIACGTVSPPTSQVLIRQSGTGIESGTLLLVDVCLNESPLIGDEYFVIANSKDAARVVLAAAEKYLGAIGFTNITGIVPFVCGAAHNTTGAPERVANLIDGDVLTLRQPFAVDETVAKDEEYLNALKTISTYIYQSALFRFSHAKSNDQPEGAVSPVARGYIVDGAIDKIKERSLKTNLVYIGITGTSLSSGKAAALGIARFASGLVFSVAAGPLFSAGGTGYYLVYVPGGITDGSQIASGVLDLRTGKLTGANVISVLGDPMKSEIFIQKDAMRLLLRDVVFYKSK